MHQEYKAGDKLFIDFTGEKLRIIDRITGSIIEKEVFVAILAASQYTYVEATDSQKKEDLIRACENALHYFGGSPKAIVPDCLKSAVTKGNKYEPEINPEFEDFANHYGICPFPARPYEARDKAHVENAVKITYSWIFAALRDKVFHSLEELNEAIRERLEIYNSKKMQKLNVSRKDLFLEIEKRELRPLPIERYEFKTFLKTKIQFNYHVYVREDNHYYSVPYRYRGKYADIILSGRSVEIFLDNIRIASHPRDRRQHVYTTNREHMPPNHRWVSDWNPDKLINWGSSIGVNVEEMIKKVLENITYPEQAYKVCLGILNLTKGYGKVRLDRACARALQFMYYSFKGVKRILEKGLDLIEEEEPLFETFSSHENIRGREYYDV
jgi:transposase